jgi:hypothetical protein
MPHNGLRAREGRETNALNCKPNTNLKEKYEVSNFRKNSGFILHAVSCSTSHSLLQNTHHAAAHVLGRVWWGKHYGRHQIKFRFYTMSVTDVRHTMGVKKHFTLFC